MKVLIIFDTTEQNYAAAVDMDLIEYRYFSQAHNYIENVHEWDEKKSEVVGVISCAFFANIYDCSTDKEKEYHGKFKTNELGEKTDISDCDSIIRCGVYY